MIIFELSIEILPILLWIQNMVKATLGGTNLSHATKREPKHGFHQFIIQLFGSND